MCGIAGIISNDKTDAIKKMTDVMTHRGPDDCGFYHDEVISLGQRRLSIIDIDGGRQPISNEDERFQLVCNGEIYNSPELRRNLIRAGHTFKTFTDIEVILHLYEDHGKECVKHLRGMFAFALWDKTKRTLFLARDHMGQKPLFYCQGNGFFVFASEIKAILASGLIEPEIDLDALWHYVSLRFIPDRYSLFKGIHKLPQASSLFLADDRAALDTYWRLEFKNKLAGSEADIVEQLDKLLLKTVEDHLLSDVEVGAFLSGGIDSSTVSAMMATITGNRIPTFSIGVREQSFNELPYARMVANKYGMDTNERIIEPDLIQIVPKMIWHLDEPSDPFGFGVYLVSQLAAKRVKVVLGGDGGDESFAGYDRFAGQQLVDYYCALPAWFRRRVMHRLIGFIPESFGYKSFAQKAAWMNDMSFFQSGERYAQSMSFLRFTAEAKARLFRPEAQHRLTDPDSMAKILCHFNAHNVDDLVDRMLFTDLMTRMPDHLLPIVDRMSMAHSIEDRSPMVDYKVVEFAAAIPGAMKLKGRNLKYILKRVAERYLPRELITRRKQGFSFPIGAWMRTDLKHLVGNLLDQSRFVERNIFDKREVQRLLQEHVSGKADHNYRLWILLNLELWHRMYFEGETPESMTNMIQELSYEPIRGVN